MGRPPKGKAIERLRKALDAISELKQLRRGSPQFEKWRRNAEVAISNTFGGNTSHVKDFRQIKYVLSGVFVPEAYYQRVYLRGLDSAASVLDSMIDEIEEYWEDDGPPVSTPSTKAREQRTANEVFVVHGTDDGPKDAVARFLTNWVSNP